MLEEGCRVSNDDSTTTLAKLVGISVVHISEAYTSQQCSNCGIIDKCNRCLRGLCLCGFYGL